MSNQPGVWQRITEDNLPDATFEWIKPGYPTSWVVLVGSEDATPPELAYYDPQKKEWYPESRAYEGEGEFVGQPDFWMEIPSLAGLLEAKP